MKLAIYLLAVLLFYSCSVKRKLNESSEVNTENVTEAQSLQTKTQHKENYNLSTDSVNRTNFLKLYPKGDFVINKDGFQGSADSLIWYSNGKYIKKHQQLERQNQEQSKSEFRKQVEKKVVKDQKKELTKATSFFWWILAGGAILGLVVILKLRPFRVRER